MRSPIYYFFRCFGITALLLVFTGLALMSSCKDKEDDRVIVNPPDTGGGNYFVRAVDMSFLPKVESAGIVFYDRNGEQNDPLTILKNNGVNTIRVRLWKDPEDPNSSLPEVKAFAERIRSGGFKFWLTVHYSDTWADPGHQSLPHQWEGISFTDLKDSVYAYTSKIVDMLRPDYIQIGNEINDGFLWPFGKISDNKTQFIQLLSTGIKAVRDHSDSARTDVHFAGIENADWFFSNLTHVGYDVMGISYYPWWHGKDLQVVESTLGSLNAKYNRELMIAETAYPFTLEWNDWTNNIVGLDEHLILPEYPASFTGQKDFVIKIKSIVKNVDGTGFCYWGGAWVAYNGPQSENGSQWENLALFDFDNKVVPAVESFGK